MRKRDEIVKQFDFIEYILTTKEYDDDETLYFDIGMLAAHAMILKSERNDFERRYAAAKNKAIRAAKC